MIRKITPANQFADNLSKRYAGDSGCCPDTTLALCQYSTTYTQSNVVSALVISVNGQNKTLACAPATTSANDVQAALYASLVAAGYDDYQEGTRGVVVTDLGATLSVVITGDVKCVSITHGGGSASFTEKCTALNLCTYAIVGYAGGTTGTAATTMRINGINYDIGTVTPGTTTSGTVQTAVGGVLTSAGVRGTTAVATTGSGGSTLYNITITVSESDNTITLNGVYFTRSACAATYV